MVSAFVVYPTTNRKVQLKSKLARTEYGLHYTGGLFVRPLLSIGSVTESVVKNLLTDSE